MTSDKPGPVIVGPATVKGERGEKWVRIDRSPDLPDGVSDLMFGFRREGERLVSVGMLVRTHSGASSALMRSLPVERLEDQARRAGEHLGMATVPRVTADPGAGRGGHSDEFLEQIHDLHRYALDRHPSRPVQWMLDEGLPERLRHYDRRTVFQWTKRGQEHAEQSATRKGKR